MATYTPQQRATILNNVRNSGPGAAAAEKIRVRKDSTVEAFGRMPNTNETGWWFAGIVEDFLPSGQEF